MNGAFESALPMRFYDDLDMARKVVEGDSVIIGSVMLEVISIRVELEHVVFMGYLPRRLAMSRFRGITNETDYIEAVIEHTEHFNTTWACVTNPSDTVGVIGFIPHGEVCCTNPIPACAKREEDTVLFGLRVKREQRSLGIKTIGKKMCRNCGDEIPEKRLNALPAAKYCADCQSLIERMN